MTSEDIAKALNEDDRFKDRPWPGWNRGKGISQNSLARLLRPFKVVPNSIRLPNGRTPKGYRRQQFEDSWKSYLRPEKEHTAPNPGFQPQQRHNPQETAKNGQFEAQQEKDGVAVENGEKPQFSAPCGGVAVENQGNGQWSKKL